MAEDANALIKESDQIEADRGNWNTLWHQIAERMLPQRAEFITTPSPGTKRTSKIFDGTAMDALNRFASGLHNNLTSKGLPWFFLEAGDESLNNLRPIKEWLEDTTRRLLSVYNNPFSNFHSRAHEMEIELGAFGNGCMFIGDRPGFGPFFRSIFLGEVNIAVNDLGTVDTIYRKYSLTMKQAIQQFEGIRLPDAITKGFVRNPNQKKKFLHVVKPRLERNAGSAGALSMPWLSAHIFIEGKQILRESGFEEFPFLFPRWKQSSGEKYGRGPGGDALADTKLLNELEKTTLVALQKGIDPPMQMPSDGFLGPLNIGPGQITYFRAGLGPNDRATPLFTAVRPELGEAKESQKREMIRRAFFLDIFELAGPVAEDGDVLHMSATEVASRRQDRLQVLGPALSRLESEYLGPLIFRTLNVMLRNRMVFEPPPEITDVGLQIRYVNPLSIAQRAPEVGSISQAISIMAPVAQLDPSVMDNFDFDSMARITADRLRVPIEVIRPPEDVAAIRAQRAEAAQKREEAEQAEMLSGAAKDLSQAGGGGEG